MDCDDVFGCEGLVCDQIEVELGFLVEFVDSIVSIDVARCSDADNVRRLSEYLVADGVLVLVHCVLVFGASPVHFDEIAGLEGLTCNWVALVLLDEGHDVENVENVAIRSADWILKGRK